jgi:hypothetical protein
MRYRAARVHHRVGHAAHQVLAEADLRVHDARGRDELAGLEVAKVRGDRRRADVHGHPEGLVMEAGPERDDLGSVVHRGGHLPLALAQQRLQRAEHVEVAGKILEVPFARERLEQAAEVAGRVVHVRLCDLDVVQAHDGVQLDLARIGILAHDLAVDLAARRNVDDDVALHLRRAGEPMARDQAAAVCVARLDLDTGETLAAPDWMPCFANSPSAMSTWQRPQMPRPPQTESTSTPSVRAAESSGVPTGKRPRLPEGMKTTSGSLPVMAAAQARARRRLSRRPRTASPSAPGGCCSRNRVIQRSQCGSWPIITSAPRQARTVSACSGFVIADVSPRRSPS